MNAPAQLPEARRRSSRGGPELCTVSLNVEVVTAIFGGGTQARSLDNVDVIRGATVRGNLRFWWRALRGHEFASHRELYQAESAVWGHAATDHGGRSHAEVRVEVERVAEPDDTDVHPQKTSGAYALWPARAEKEKGRVKTPPAPRADARSLLLAALGKRTDEGFGRVVAGVWRP